MEKSLRIVFMGTPDFAVKSLDMLYENGFEIAAVITSPDKPAGRGLKVVQSAVKKYAEINGLRVLQPTNLKDESFINTLKEINPDLQVVVAFRMLPEVVWKLPKFGTFNLHASLLPQYRGAAPINWVVMNGEKVTGATTFFINENIDTGEIILQEEVEIEDVDTAGDLHDKLMVSGAGLVLKTARLIESGDCESVSQKGLIREDELKLAPKIFKEDCRIDWKQDVNAVYNFIRGLSPYPAAWTELIKSDGEKTIVKVFSIEKEEVEHPYEVGGLVFEDETHIEIAVKNGVIRLKSLQQSGKKRLSDEEFLRGVRDFNKWQLA